METEGDLFWTCFLVNLKRRPRRRKSGVKFYETKTHSKVFETKEREQRDNKILSHRVEIKDKVDERKVEKVV